jgi:hypothetical protein
VRKEHAMTTQQVDRTVVTGEPSAAAGQKTVQTDTRRTTTSGPAGTEFARRIIVFLFGLIQIVIGARIVLLLIGAQEANTIVTAVLNVSQIFVAPFEGILRTDAIHAAGSTLDVAAVVAFVGWTILELIVLWVVAIFRRKPDSANV